MKKAMGTVAVGWVLAGLGQAEAGLVYDNNSNKGANTAYAINNGWSVSDSLRVTAPTDLGLAQVELIADPGSIPGGLQWSIGTSAFGSEIASGTAFLTSTCLNPTWGGKYALYQSSFAINGSVGAGTYYLTLHDAVASNGGCLFWEDNGGPSCGYQDGCYGYFNRPSESFRIYSVSPVPEPSTVIAGVLLLLPFGFSSLRYWRRTKPLSD